MRNNDNKWFWEHVSGLYQKAVYHSGKSQRAYDRMIYLIRKHLTTDMLVLELAAGPGVLSARIANKCKWLIATDFSEKMISKAKQVNERSNITYQVQDATKLSFESEMFDCILIANALHIMPNPRKALRNCKRVLKDDGILIAPTFIGNGHEDNWKQKLMGVFGFRTYSSWTEQTYLAFLKKNGFEVIECSLITGHVAPICFVVAKKRVIEK